jgi:hypothetical protein
VKEAAVTFPCPIVQVMVDKEPFFLVIRTMDSNSPCSRWYAMRSVLLHDCRSRVYFFVAYALVVGIFI